MDTKLEKIVIRVKELSDLLYEYGETGWANFLNHCNEHILAGDDYGLKELNTLFSDMESFNKLMITKKKGSPLKKEEIIEINEKLSNLNSEIFSRLIDLQIES